MLPAIVLAVVLSAGSHSGQTPSQRQQFIIAQSSPPTYVEDQHWGGFDAPDDSAITVTGLMWIQQSPSLLGGTFVFELRHSDGTLLCSGSTTCNVDANTDIRVSCSAILPAGEHANLMAGTGSTCTTLPGGNFTVRGLYGG